MSMSEKQKLEKKLEASYRKADNLKVFEKAKAIHESLHKKLK